MNIKTNVFHPFLLAILPVVYSLVEFPGTLIWSEAVIVSLILLALASLIYLLFQFILKNYMFAALVTTGILILLFLVGPVNNYLYVLNFEEVRIRHYLFALSISGTTWFFLREKKVYSSLLLVVNLAITFLILVKLYAVLYIAILAFIYVLYKKPKYVKPVTVYFNIVFMVLIAINLFILAFDVIKSQMATNDYSVNGQINKELPDIYYIILDGYARNDIFEELYEYDNSWFTNYLEDKGFFVAKNSLSNYNQTILSLTSTFEMKFHPLNKSFSKSKFLSEFKHFSTLEELQNKGYYITVFSSGIVRIHTSARYVNPFAINDFFNYMIYNSPFSGLNTKSLFRTHKERMFYNLETLADVAVNDKPNFIFAHFMCPHPPFVFVDEKDYIEEDFHIWDGSHLVNEITLEKYRELYANQVDSLNKMVIKTLDHIFNNSNNPPIIILQSDHGARSGLAHESFERTDIKEAYSNLFAIYFPDGDYDMLYDSISNINTFVVLFNKIFEYEIELFEDKTYWSNFSNIFIEEVEIE